MDVLLLVSKLLVVCYSVVWKYDSVQLTGHMFCRFMFGLLVMKLSTFMCCMEKQSVGNGFEIFCMDTLVQVSRIRNLSDFFLYVLVKKLFSVSLLFLFNLYAKVISH